MEKIILATAEDVKFVVELYDSVNDYFEENGANNIRLSTKPDNARALSLYHQFGFQENGEMNGEEIVLELTI